MIADAVAFPFATRWQAELLEADERAGRRYIQQIEELRDQLEREKESACTRERELSQQRYRKVSRALFASFFSIADANKASQN